MKFSTRSTYGLRAVIKLGQNWGKGPISLAQISEEENISLSYLERIFAKLKKDKIVKAIKGSRGGYVLSRSPAKISLWEILNSLEGRITPFYCISEQGKIYCQAKHNCQVASVLLKLQNIIRENLQKMNLEQVIKNKI